MYISYMKNIVILGGGTAGWLTSLYVNQLFPNSNIIQVESSDIGILGAGEGSVPILPTFLRALKIDESDFVKKTNATYKMGINFENWNGDEKNYFHPFSPALPTLQYNNVTKELPIIGGLPASLFSPYLVNSLANDRNLDDVIPSSKLALNNKCPFIQQDGVKKSTVGFSYHFDARLTANYLKELGVSRGIRLLNGNVESFTKTNGDITEVVLESGLKVSCDFIFDCSGFNRLIIGKEYNTEWIPYDKHLTVNTAIPFFLPQDEDYIKPYTRAIAMKYGWMWQIPLQNRWGCGYIFDDRYITSEEAKNEVEELLGHPIESNRTFKFSAGSYKTTWVNNCIAIGLSGGFIEPLEATSIMTSIMSLLALDPIALQERNLEMVNEYNEYVESLNEEIVAFLYYHYMNQRNDSEFWKEYQSKTEVPAKLKKLLSKWDKKAIHNLDTTIFSPSNIFAPDSWLSVGVGNKTIDIELYKKYNKELMLDKRLGLFFNNFIKNLDNTLENSISHLDHIKKI